MAGIHEVKVHTLHPTQITVGMIEVRDKLRELAAMTGHAQRDFLAAHPIPAVRGPEEETYLTDHHHLGLAVWEAGIADVFVTLKQDWSDASLEQFWREMAQGHLAPPIDERDESPPYREIPKHVQKLRDDVYRSLAGYVREAGGFEKSPTPFAPVPVGGRAAATRGMRNDTRGLQAGGGAGAGTRAQSGSERFAGLQAPRQGLSRRRGSCLPGCRKGA